MPRSPGETADGRRRLTGLIALYPKSSPDVSLFREPNGSFRRPRAISGRSHRAGRRCALPRTAPCSRPGGRGYGRPGGAAAPLRVSAGSTSAPGGASRSSRRFSPICLPAASVSSRTPARWLRRRRTVPRPHPARSGRAAGTLRRPRPPERRGAERWRGRPGGRDAYAAPLHARAVQARDRRKRASAGPGPHPVGRQRTGLRALRAAIPSPAFSRVPRLPRGEAERTGARRTPRIRLCDLRSPRRVTTALGPPLCM